MMLKGNNNSRFWEIDFLRGIAIIMMIVFHLFFDLNYFAIYSAGLRSDLWLLFQYATATIFIFLVGVSLTLSYSRASALQSGVALYKKYVLRGLKIFSWGLIITLLTWLFLRAGFIIFGILHFIGIAIIIAFPFLRLRKANLLLAAAFIAIGIYLRNFTFDFPWLLWLGFMPSAFYTLDYFPLFPWFGIVLLGISFGNKFYAGGIRRFCLRFPVELPLKKQLCFLGRNSLVIYLLHQPVLIALLYLLGLH